MTEQAQRIAIAEKLGWTVVHSSEKSDKWMHIYFLVTATARQRCEAFLRTFGLWKEGE